MTFVPFGEWLPDQPDLNNPGVLKANGVFPYTSSYLPVPGWTDVSTDRLSTTPRGAFGATNQAGDVYIYAGDDTKLYEISASLSWSDESGATYGPSADPLWEFALFDNLIVATNLNDPVQSMIAGAGASSAFADMITSTNKPKAKHVAVIRDFVVLGDTNDTADGVKSNRVWWSAFRDATDFDPDATTQCDFEDLEFGGRVTKIVGGVEYGVVFQERAIRRMTYVGSPAVFRFDAVDRQRGTPYPKSVCGHGRLIFYLSEEGFFVFDGTASHPIGEPKIDNTFLDQFDPTNKNSLSCAIDPKRKLYIITFPGTDSGSGLPNKSFAYYWPGGRWSEIIWPNAGDDAAGPFFVFKAQTFGYTLDTLDTVSTNIDTGFTESFDSDVWKGGRFQLAAINSAGRLVFLTGSNLTATIGTAEGRTVPNKRAFIENMRPLVDGTTAVVGRLGRREQLGEAVTFTSTQSMNSIGEIPFRASARYHRAEIIIPAGETWTHALGIDIPEDSVRPVGRN